MKETANKNSIDKIVTWILNGKSNVQRDTRLLITLMGMFTFTIIILTMFTLLIKHC